ncbi:scarecrow-like protein 15 [Chenopodium quinoa]|uniref:scarecrow-like protein 15 n=1 Tax=Chenopodium quinoa TaxID=63459 RepID=UPI000B78E279|nr:scarecrow-like protein 15 [Chenopodium quinoa]
MKVPVSTPQTCNTVTGKPISADNNNNFNTTFHSPSSNISSNNNSNSNNNNNNNLCYEPTSVLDLQRSPSSPAGATKTVTSTPPPQPPSSDTTKNNNNVDLDNLEGWDSILSELGLTDDSNSNNPKLLLSQISPCDSSHLTQVLPDFPSSQNHFTQNHPPLDLPSDYANFCDFSYNQNLNPNFSPFDHHQQQQQQQQLHHHHQTTAANNTSFGLDFLDDLIRAAQAFESNASQQVHLILARLNQRLRSPVGKPLQRAAFYFKEALQHLTTTTNNNSSSPRPPRLSSYEVVQTIRARKAFSGISPVSLFSTFAANQAILEAVVDGTSPFIHIIDFDIGFGGHWASFMRELVDKATDQTTKMSTSIILRITAIVPEEFGIESKLVKENLMQFARDLNLNFHIDFVLIPTFEILSFKSMKIMEGEKLAVHLSPAVFNRFSNNSRSGISKFLGDLRGISPSCVVVVDKEVGIDAGTASFGPTFLAGIEFYTGMIESIEVAAASGFAGGGFSVGGDCLRRIETFVLRPRIFAVVEAAARVAAGRRTSWREAFVAAGMRAVGFSQFADFQAECLLRRAQVAGFHVAKRHGEMMLFWHDRPLIATSAWRC